MTASDSNDLITVLLVEDHSKVRAAMRAILESSDDIQVVGEAGEGKLAVELAERDQPEVLLLDLDLAVVSGEIAVEVLLSRLPRTRVIVLTSYDDREFASAFLEEGAVGCILKDDVPRSLVRAIHAVHSNPGRVWVSPRLMHN